MKNASPERDNVTIVRESIHGRRDKRSSREIRGSTHPPSFLAFTLAVQHGARHDAKELIIDFKVKGVRLEKILTEFPSA